MPRRLVKLSQRINHSFYRGSSFLRSGLGALCFLLEASDLAGERHPALVLSVYLSLDKASHQVELLRPDLLSLCLKECLGFMLEWLSLS